MAVVIPAPPPHAAAPVVLGRDLALADVLAEPAQRAPGWLATVYARVLVVSAGPLVLGDVMAAYPAAADRLRAARVEVVTADASPDDVAEARRYLWPTLADLADLDVGAGSPHPSLVLVGDKPSGTFGPRRPWLARCGIWLFDALRRLGHDELTVYLTNAHPAVEGRAQPRQLARLRDVLAPAAPTWVALGRAAERTLTRAGIEYVHAHHPSHARRFHYDAGAKGYAELLRAAGVPEGPWRGRPLPRQAVDAGAEPDLPPPFGGLPRAFGTGAKATRGSGRPPNEPGCDPVKAEAARRLYVTGEASTFKAAAEAVGASYGGVCAAARRQDWRREKREHAEEVRMAAKRKALEKEVEHIGLARSAAWEALKLAMTALRDKLRDDTSELSVGDVERLVKCANVLSQHRDDIEAMPVEAGVGAEMPDDAGLVSAYMEMVAMMDARFGEGFAARVLTEGM